MADILIRGMEMPNNCPHCEFAAIGYASPMSSDCTLYCRAVDKFKDCATEILKDKPYEVISHYNDRPDWCPLLPLPAGHGDLIDRDAFRADYGLGKDCENCDRNTRNCNYDICLSRMDVCGWIDDAPTIVPAEGGTEECSEN